jgi:hypothetical protein
MKHLNIDATTGHLRPEGLAQWQEPLTQGVVAGSLASVLSSAVLVLLGRRQTGSAAASTNATSQWLWGKEALYRQKADLRHTVPGYLIHHGAAVFWATAYALLAHKRPGLRTPAGIAAGAVTTSAAACFVDFNLTPSRFTPGYGAFAIGLAAGAWALRDRYPATYEPEDVDGGDDARDLPMEV